MYFIWHFNNTIQMKHSNPVLIRTCIHETMQDFIADSPFNIIHSYVCHVNAKRSSSLTFWAQVFFPKISHSWMGKRSCIHWIIFLHSHDHFICLQYINSWPVACAGCWEWGGGGTFPKSQSPGIPIWKNVQNNGKIS